MRLHETESTEPGTQAALIECQCRKEEENNKEEKTRQETKREKERRTHPKWLEIVNRLFSFMGLCFLRQTGTFINNNCFFCSPYYALYVSLH